MSSLLLGAHVEQEDPLAAARERSADIVQFFLGDPQGYKGPKFAYAGGAEGLKADAESAGVGLYVHAPYLINVATTNNKIRIPSRKLLQQHVNGAASIGAQALIVHGGHVGGDDELDTGFDNWRKAVDQLDQKLLVLIENTAGGDHAMARHLDRIARLWDAIGAASGGSEIGFCLDTCHFHAGGEELATVVDRVKAITGRIDLVHANDSMDPFDSGRDRHQNLGKGEIAPADLITVIRAAGAPVIVETPSEDAGQTADIAWLREQL